MPHYVTQRGNRRQQVFFLPRRLRDLSRAVGRGLRRGRCGGLGLLADAQSRPTSSWCRRTPRACARRWGEAHRRYTRHVNLTRGLARLSLARTLRLLSNGSGASSRRGTLCRTQSGAREARAPRRRLALVERAVTCSCPGTRSARHFLGMTRQECAQAVCSKRQGAEQRCRRGHGNQRAPCATHPAQATAWRSHSRSPDGELISYQFQGFLPVG